MLTLLSSHVLFECTSAFLHVSLEGVLGERKPRLLSHPLSCVLHTREWPSCRYQSFEAHHTLVWLLSVSLTHQTSPPFRNGSPLHLLPTWLLMEEDGSHWGMQRTCSHFIPCSTSSPPSLCLSLVPPLSLLPMAPPLLFPLWGGPETGKNMKGVQCPQMA